MLVELCDELLEEFEYRLGVAGKIRQMVLIKLMRPARFDAVAVELKMSPRTLRRKLREESTSYRKLIDELRRNMALKYLRDRNLTVEQISSLVGFSEAANFRHAFRRWTKTAPARFRGISGRA